MRKTAILLFWLMAWLLAPAQKTSFFAEDLNFVITDSLFEVDGLYYFRNNTGFEVQQLLFYPFPDAVEFGAITFITVNVSGDTSNLTVKQTAKGALFQLELEANGEKIYRINYGQRSTAGKAKYIITTTRSWKQPFEFARYSLTFPDTFIVDSTSILPDSISLSRRITKYLWHETDFMPEVDFYFEYHKKNKTPQ